MSIYNVFGMVVTYVFCNFEFFLKRKGGRGDMLRGGKVFVFLCKRQVKMINWRICLFHIPRYGIFIPFVL